MMDLNVGLSAATYKSTIKILREQTVEERPMLDLSSAERLIEILLQVIFSTSYRKGH
jgi:hypothetical protein